VNLTQYLATKWAEPKLNVVTEGELTALRNALPKALVSQSHWVADRRGAVGSLPPPSNSTAKPATNDSRTNTQQLRFSFPVNGG
jgi:hypothetical protein